MEGPRRPNQDDDSRSSFNQDQYEERHQPQPEPQQIHQYSQGSKKKKVEKPYKHILRAELCNTQQYHQDRIYFKWPIPYPIQLRYMKNLLNALDTRQHCLLEAPTGSGKTLCLLNSIFGWLVNSKDTEPRRVIFTSRSHTQLQQVKKQILKTCYRPNMLIFAGRKKMCCNEKIKKDQNQQNIYNQCTKAVQYTRVLKKIKRMTQQQKVKKGITSEYVQEVMENMCQYFSDYPQRKGPAFSIYKSLSGKPITIQDEYQANFKQKKCPYYYPSTVKYFPDLILMPYNYVLNKKILPRNQNVIKDSILIFDQGHNILEAARDGLTASITLSEIKRVIDLLKTCENKAKKNFDDFPDPINQNSGSDEQQIQQNKDKPRVVLQIEKQKQKEQKKQKEENKQKGKKKQQEKTPQALINAIQKTRGKIDQIYQKFKKYQQQNFNANNKDKIHIVRGKNQRNIVKTFVKIFFNQQLTQGNNFPHEQIKKYARIIEQIAFQLNHIYNIIDSQSKQTYKPVYLIKFAQNIKQIASIVKDKDLLFNYGLFFEWIKVEKEKNKTTASHILQVKFYCYNPKLMFDILKKLPMSMVVTSGTLSPMDTWEIQSGVKFLQMPGGQGHVIDKQQCLTVFMPQYKGNQAYYTTGQNQQNIPVSAKRSMEAIINICKGTPGGVLVIVPSTKWVAQMKRIFPSNQIAKKPFYQQKGNEYMKNIQKFQQVYKEACNTNSGAIVFAKCRGQLTQGIDFADNMCRSVVVVGYPYPDMSDPYLKGKLNFFDRCKQAGISQIDGQKWKQKQIIRAVNQGIGRVIRHKDDYGMIFLMDARYKFVGIKQHISGWALKNKTTIKDHKDIQPLCEKFFQLQRNRIQQNT